METEPMTKERIRIILILIRYYADMIVSIRNKSCGTEETKALTWALSQYYKHITELHSIIEDNDDTELGAENPAQAYKELY